MILLISLLILVHEAGHFVVAKMCGMTVSKFGFGLPIGPTLFEKKFGDTTVYIHAFLLGGYISFPDDEKDCELPEDSPELFQNKPLYQRAAVVSAGVIANVICAIVLVIFTAFMWGKLPAGEYDIAVKRVLEQAGESTKLSGIQSGDKLISINGYNVKHPMQLNLYAKASAEYNGNVNADRVDEKLDELLKLNGKNFDKDTAIKKDTKIILPKYTDEEKIVLQKEELYGLKPKNKQPTVNLTNKEQKLRDKLVDKTIYIADSNTSLKEIATAISDTKTPLLIVVERNGIQIPLKAIYPSKQGLIGIEKTETEVYKQTTGIKSGMVNSVNYLYTNTYLMIWSLGKIFTGQVPLKDLHGIVAIAKVGGDTIAYQGLFKGLLLTAIISLNLAIMNLLPIPALDGGHLMFMIIEKIQGKPVDAEISEKIGTICFYLLILLMIVILFNDIVGLVTKKF